VLLSRFKKLSEFKYRVPGFPRLSETIFEDLKPELWNFLLWRVFYPLSKFGGHLQK
jgi:hypothetical protein